MWPFNKKNRPEIKKKFRQNALYQLDNTRKIFCKLLIVNSKEFAIPEDVMEIGAKAFSGYSCPGSVGALERVIISEEILRISDKSFNNSPSLKSIIVEEGNEEYSHIDGVLFSLDRRVLCRYPEGKPSQNGAYVVPKDVVTIRPYAFYRCKSLKHIAIPDSVKRIGSDAFSGCSSLTKFEVENNNTKYCSVDGVLFSKDKKKLIVNPAGRKMKEYVIPEGVISIEDGAFDGCSSLSSVEIPSSVTSIGKGAFRGGAFLSSVTIPSSVTSIREDTFRGCSSLSSIKIPDGVISIGDRAFLGCSSLSSIKIPDGVISIGDRAFLGCSSLSSIEIPSSVTSIGDRVFRDCSSLSSLVIPSSVTSIGDRVFRDCFSLSSLVIPSSVTSIGDSAFFDCFSLSSLAIPDSVTCIGRWAFAGCSSLSSLAIPDSVISIGRGAFLDCSELTLRVYKGSYAEWYARENQIKYKTL